MKDGTDFTKKRIKSKDKSLMAKPDSNKGADDLFFLSLEFLLNLLKTNRVRTLPTIPKIHRLPVIPTDMINL